jgi:tRNA(Ile)-lysidine synthase
MLLGFENKIAGFIKNNELFSSESKVLLAISGGADSIALLHVIYALKTQDVLHVDVHCAHINHQLRVKQADKDENFVTRLVAGLNLTITTKRINVYQFACENKLSIETAARNLRIESLLDIAKANSCDCIATGHQQNDNAETIIHRLLRGTGYRGLAGIWPERKFNNGTKFVRPLLCVTRDEIIRYLQQKEISWCEDYTNVDCKFTRNFIRNQLLPALQKESNSSLTEQLSDLSIKAGRFYKRICSEVEALWSEISKQVDGAVIVDLNIFQSQPHPVKIELIRRSLDCIGCGQRDLTQGHFKRIIQLAEKNISGKTMQLPNGFVVRCEYKNLSFSKKKNSIEKQVVTSLKLKIPGQVAFDRFLIKVSILEVDEVDFKKYKATKPPSIEWFDFEKINLPLVIRFRRPGDRFIPLGQTEEKKVGKFLTAQRVPYEIRRNILIIEDREKLIWVCPVRISEYTKIDKTTQKILQLEIIESK